MNDIKKNMRATLLAAQLRQGFVDWLRAEADRLVSAAEFLGGEPWQERATAVADAVASGAEPEDVEADLVALHRLLTRDVTDDFDSLGSVRCLAVQPDDPCADDAQVCAEALERGLVAMRIYAAGTTQEVA